MRDKLLEDNAKALRDLVLKAKSPDVIDVVCRDKSMETALASPEMLIASLQPSTSAAMNDGIKSKFVKQNEQESSNMS